MIKYNWNCKTVDAYPEHGGKTNVVYNIHWRVTGTSDQLDSNNIPHSVTSIGIQALSTDDLTNFTSCDSLVHSDVVNWTKTAIGKEQITDIEESIEDRINSLIKPKSITLTVAEDTANR